METKKKGVRVVQSTLAIVMLLMQVILPTGGAVLANSESTNPVEQINQPIDSAASAVELNTPMAPTVDGDLSFYLDVASDNPLPSAPTDPPPETFYAGEPLVYSLGVFNNGTISTTNTTVTVTLPLGVEYLADTDTCSLTSSSPDMLSCDLGTLESYDYLEFYVSTLVTSTLVRNVPNGTLAVVTQAGVSADQPDPNLENNFDELTYFVQDIADLRINKFVEPHTGVRTGEQFTYTILVDNLGPSTARNIVVTDSLITSGFVNPNGCSLAIRTDGGLIDEFNCNFALATGVFDLATMGANWLNPRSPHDMGRMIITINATADGAPSQEIDLTNFTTVTSDTPDPNLENNESWVPLSITNVVDLSLTKTALGEVQVSGQEGDIFDINNPGAFPAAPWYSTSPTNVTAGRRISYAIEVTNNSDTIAENVVVSDLLPLGVTVIPGTLSVSQGSCDLGTPGDPLAKMTCGLGSLSYAGNSDGDPFVVTISFDVFVDDSILPGKVLTNNAQVVSDTFDPDNSNDYASTQTIVETWADMSITKLSVGENVTGYDSDLRRFIMEDLPGQVTAGNQLRYEITVQNNGPSDAQNVQILDLLPGQTDTGLDHDPVTFLYADGANCRPMTEEQEIGVFNPSGGKFGQVLWCDLGVVPAGARVTFDVYVSVDPAVPDGFTLTNGAFVWWGASSPPADPGSFLPFPFPQIPPELPTTDDPFLDNNFADTDTQVNAVADVWITKVDVPASADLDQPFEPDNAVAGNEHRYLLTFGNDGPSVATDIAVQDFLDFMQFAILGETFLRCEPFDIDDFVSCSESNGVVDVDLLLKQNEQVIPGDLNPGESFSFYLITAVDPGYVLDANDFIATNDSRITTTSTDFHTASNVDAHDSEIIGHADLSIEKEAEFVEMAIDSPVEATGMLTYTIDVMNHGPSDAAQVYVVDWLPAEGLFLDPALISVTVSAGQVTEVSDDGRITVIVGNDMDTGGTPELGRLNVGSSEMITITAYVRPDVETGTLVNVAMVETRQNDALWPQAPDLLPGVGGGPRTPTADPDLSNNTAYTGDYVEDAVDLSIEKFMDPALIDAGVPVTYTLVVHNAGPMQAENVVVEDDLPSGLMLLDSSLSGAGVCLGSDVVTCNLGHLGPGATVTITLNVLLDADLKIGTVVRNDASVSSDDFDSDLVNNFASVASTIGMSADLEITKTALASVLSGEEITYQISVINHGPSDVLGARVTDLVPAGLVDVSWSCIAYNGACSESGEGAIDEFVDIPVGESLEYTLMGTIDGFETVTNTAMVMPQFGLVDPDMSNNTAWAINEIFATSLPMVANSQARTFAPDLVVSDVSISQASVEITIMNVGLKPVEDPFWVDLYIDPFKAPTAVNQVWTDLANQGMVWGVDAEALPLAPGESLTLSVGDVFYWELGSYVEWPLKQSSKVYVQVDTFAEEGNFGAVAEDHELLDQSYNNIAGFYKPTFVAGASAPTYEPTSQTFDGLPPRDR